MSAFCDDVISLILEVAKKIVLKTASIARIAKRVFCMFKLELNFKPGKSEAVVMFAGIGKNAATLQLYTQNYQCCKCVQPEK